ncbi:MAG: molybdenum cofactor guanylyltransferase MobA [Pseudomonadota bacterium]
MKIAGVILAGGLARRMGGGDKALLQVAGRPLLAHVIARLAPQVDAMVLNANGDPSRFGQFGLPVVPDTVEGFAGPLAGVLAGMRWAAARGHSHVASAAGDTPFFPENLVVRLREALAARGDEIAVAATEDPKRGLSEHPTFGLWPCALADDLEAALRAEMRKVIVWASRHGCARALFADAGAYPFFNVNTPEDLAEAERLVAGSAEKRLAVYGTLAPGQVNHHQLAGLSGQWLAGTVRGRLLEGGWGAAHGCPGIVLDTQGEEVAVQIFTSADLPAHWSRLDAFEGPGYRRRVARVMTAAGEIDASIYELAP